MKGFGTDEKALISILSNKDPLQIDTLRAAYERAHRRNLVSDIQSETSSWFEKALVQLARGPLLSDVHNLHEAMSGPGTKELVLNDILLGRSNADLQAIKSAYYHTFHDKLENVVKGDLSMKTERHFMLVLAANRAEDSAPVDPRQVDDDVMQIYKATEGKLGTDEILVCSILSKRNDNQIRAIAHTYKQKFNKDLEKVIKSVSLVSITHSTPLLTCVGIFWPHGGCTPLPAAPCHRQVHARSQASRGLDGRHGHQGPSSHCSCYPLPLGSHHTRQHQGSLPATIRQKPGKPDQGGDLGRLQEDYAGSDWRALVNDSTRKEKEMETMGRLGCKIASGIGLRSLITAVFYDLALGTCLALRRLSSGTYLGQRQHNLRYQILKSFRSSSRILV